MGAGSEKEDDLKKEGDGAGGKKARYCKTG